MNLLHYLACAASLMGHTDPLPANIMDFVHYRGPPAANTPSHQKPGNILTGTIIPWRDPVTKLMHVDVYAVSKPRTLLHEACHVIQAMSLTYYSTPVPQLEDECELVSDGWPFCAD